MDRLCKRELCTGCGACASICPSQCIRMEADCEGFLRPVIDIEHCVHCNRCQKCCPVLNRQECSDGNSIAYAAIHLDERVRYNSTSGGVFTALCQWVFQRNGVVFGAAYDENFAVVHCRADNYDSLQKKRGAKYSQSRLSDTFQQVKTCLQDGQYVVFSGTPCQVGGLIAFLGQYACDDKLILVDLICHGVPSPKVWEHYIAYRRKQDADGELPTDINLRSKESGWPGYSIRFEYSGGKVYSAVNSQDPYLRGFVGDLYLRPSCYDCCFKGSSRRSDFTLGDYWGVWSQCPEFDDGKGTSLVLLHTEKAQQIWQQISSGMRYTEVNIAEALTDNPSAVVSSVMTTKRQAFFSRFENEVFDNLIEELCPKQIASPRPSIAKRVIHKIGRVLRNKLMKGNK